MKISVITAVLNGEKYLASCLQSLRCQSHSDYEHIVIDACSTDGTAGIIERYRSGIAQCLHEKDGGIYEGLNKGLKLAGGEVIGVLHADDMYADRTVLSAVAGAFEDSGADCVYGDVAYVSKESADHVIRYWRAGEGGEERLRMGWMPPHTGLFVRKSVFEQYGNFDTHFKIAADYELILRFLKTHRLKAYYLKKLLVKMRVGGASNRSLAAMMRKSREDYEACKRHGLPHPLATVALKNLVKVPQFFVKNHDAS